MWRSSSWIGVIFGRRTMSSATVWCVSQPRHLKVGVARIERVAEGRRGLRGTLKGEHALRPGFAGELVGFPARFSGALGRDADRAAVKPVAGFGAHGGRMRRMEQMGKPLLLWIAIGLVRRTCAEPFQLHLPITGPERDQFNGTRVGPFNV